MPEEQAQGTKGSQSPPESHAPPPQTPSTTNVSWVKVILTVLIIVIVTAIIAGAYWYFVLGKSTGEVDTSPIKVSTPSAKKATESAKKATESAKKDETADWKTYTNSKKGFSIKYPTTYFVEDISSDEFGVNFNSPDKSLSKPPIVILEKGGFISIYVKEVSGNNLDTEFNKYLQETKTKSKTYTTLGGSKAIKSTLIPYETTYSDDPVVIFTLKDGRRFVVSMYAEQKSLQDVNRTFELMLSTFRFD